MKDHNHTISARDCATCRLRARESAKHATRPRPAPPVPEPAEPETERTWPSWPW